MTSTAMRPEPSTPEGPKLDRGESLRKARAALDEKRAREKAVAPPDPKKPAAPSPVASFSDADLARNLAGFTHGVWKVLQLLAYLAGAKLDPLTDDEATGQAKLFIPLARTFPAFARASLWLGAPFALVALVSSKLRRREKAPGPGGATPVPPGPKAVA